MVGQETPKKQSNLVSQEKGKSCLYVPSADSTLSQSAAETLLKIGLSIIECADFHTAKKLCEEKTYALILLEECEDKEFFINIKRSESLNEQTPVVLIFSDTLSDTARSLVKDQYIDDVIYKCTTFDTDLEKAIKRLIDEPLHFAVTPKAKKSETKKSDGSTPKRPRLDKTPISARKRILELPPNDAVTQQTEFQSEWPVSGMDAAPLQPMMIPPPPVYTDHTYTNMDTSQGPLMYANPAQGYQSNPGMANGAWMPLPPPQYHYFPDYVPGYQPAANSMGMLTAAVEMSLAEEQSRHSAVSVVSSTADVPCAVEEVTVEQQQEDNLPQDSCTMDISASQENQEQASDAAIAYSDQDNNRSYDTTPQPPTNDPNPVSSAQSAPQSFLDTLPQAPPLQPLRDTIPQLSHSVRDILPQTYHQDSQAEEMIPRITLDGARQLLDSALQGLEARTESQGNQLTAAIAKCLPPIEGNEETDVNVSTVTPLRMSAKRKRASLSSLKDDASPLRTPTTAGERKEAHLAKERKRRERIARCWCMLRRMIPSCSETADKATVFEMTVAYIHHCWRHNTEFITKINKDFQQLCNVTAPPDDMDTMEEMVESILKKEKR